MHYSLKYAKNTALLVLLCKAMRAKVRLKFDVFFALFKPLSNQFIGDFLMRPHTADVRHRKFTMVITD